MTSPASRGGWTIHQPVNSGPPLRCVKRSDGTQIAILRSDATDLEAAQMCAAPELAEALLRALPEMERTFDEMGSSETDHYANHNCPSACGLPAVIDQARLALARAGVKP